MRCGKIENRESLRLWKSVLLLLLVLFYASACQSEQERFDAKFSQCMDKRGDEIDEGIACLQNLLKSYPENLYIQKSLASKYAQAGQLNEAEEAIEIYLTYYSKDASGYELKCEILGDKGNLSEAEHACFEAVFIEPDNASLWVTSAMLSEKLGNISRAERQYKDALSMNPENELALVSLGRLYEKNNRLDEAIQYYEKLAEVTTKNDKGKILNGIEKVKEKRRLQQETNMNTDNSNQQNK